MASMEAVFENARKGHVEFFTTQETLQQYIISVDEDQRSLLHNAVTSGKPELVQYLLQHGAAPTVNAQDEEVRHVRIAGYVKEIRDGLLCIQL